MHHHPDQFDFRIYEAHGQIGGNAITADKPQSHGSSIPFDISVTACIPSVYHHIVLLMEKFGTDLIDTRFSYSVKYGDRVYAHEFNSEIRAQLQFEIAKFQRLLRRLHRIGRLTRSQPKLLNAQNPFNYSSMGTVLINLFRFVQGKRRTWHCGAHTLIDSQETCFVSGLGTARQIGAGYPFDDPAAKRSFNYNGSIMYGLRFRKA